MALVLKDRVKETTTTTSTGTYTLGGAQVGYQAFSVVGDGNTTYYTVTDGTNWEVGIGTYTLSGTTLSRDTILASSNSGNAVNWGVGSKDVFLTYPAERSVYVDGSDIVPATTASYAGNVTTIQLRNSSTPGAIPSALSLSSGELVVNTADGKLYFKDSGGAVQVLAQANQIAPLTTKGDLIVNDGTNNIRLPVGTNGHVLTADSTLAAGVKWAAGGGGGGVTSVTATAPLASSGGTTPDISLTGAVPIANGGTGQTGKQAAFNALSPASSKGDLIAYTGATNDRLPVGTNNQVLMATSGASLGVAWSNVLVDVQDFSTVGTSTWTKPAGAKMVYVLLFGGGGGGGGGRRRSTAGISACGGGGAGAGSGRSDFWILASDLDATESVVVGGGGSGGAGATTNDTSGGSGSDGGTSNFAGIAYALGGGAGLAGTTTGGNGGSANGGNGELRVGQVSYLASGGNGATSLGNAGSTGGYRGGGGGGGAGNTTGSTASNTGGAGGLGGALGAGSNATIGGGGAGGTGDGGAGTAGANAVTYFYGGSGGGGGGNGISAAAGAGGAGGFPGGGGGGGGAGTARNGGNGGDGAQGYVRVVTFF